MCAMKTVQFNLPDEVADRLEKLLSAQSAGYVSVNSTEVSERDALFTDLLILGLDELDVGENEFPDDN